MPRKRFPSVLYARWVEGEGRFMRANANARKLQRESERADIAVYRLVRVVKHAHAGAATAARYSRD
jgi:hypothetical protein